MNKNKGIMYREQQQCMGDYINRFLPKWNHLNFWFRYFICKQGTLGPVLYIPQLLCPLPAWQGCVKILNYACCKIISKKLH